MTLPRIVTKYPGLSYTDYGNRRYMVVDARGTGAVLYFQTVYTEREAAELCERWVKVPVWLQKIREAKEECVRAGEYAAAAQLLAVADTAEKLSQPPVTEPCCSCGASYPREDLLQGNHIYCRECR